VLRQTSIDGKEKEEYPDEERKPISHKEFAL